MRAISADRHGTAFEALEPRTLLDAHLVVSLGAIMAGKGEELHVAVTVANTGDRADTAKETLHLFLSESLPGYAIDDHQLSVGDKQLPVIGARQKKTFSFSFNRPTQLVALGRNQGYDFSVSTPSAQPGDYYAIARVDSSTGAQDLVAHSPNTAHIDYRFGTVNGKHRDLTAGVGTDWLANATYPGSALPPSYVSASTQSEFVTLKIDGPGIGALSFDRATGARVVTVSGTTSRSTLTISGARSTTPTLDEVIINGPLQNLRIDHAFARVITVNSSIKEIDTGAFSLKAPGGSFVTASINITNPASSPVIIHTGDIVRMNINSAAPIKTLEVNSWTDQQSTITAPAIGKIVSHGDFAPTLLLSGSPLSAQTVSSVDIKGAATGGWSITGNVGDASVGGRSVTWSIAGDLNSLRIRSPRVSSGGGTSGGILAARNIGKLTFDGDSYGIEVYAGATFALDAPLHQFTPSPGSTFGGGTIGSIEAGGVLSGIFAAGIDFSSTPFPGHFVPGGPSRIGKITSKGTPFNSFVQTFEVIASSLPATAIIAGRTIATAGDPRFVSVV